MKSLTLYPVFILFFCLAGCHTENNTTFRIPDPGHFDSTWWNHEPMRLIQTNLPETKADVDPDAYVDSVVAISANTVLLNVGGIVANYPTKLEFQYRNPYVKGDMVGEIVRKLHAKGIKVFGRFDFSKINEKIAAKKPEWLYVGTDGKTVNYNGEVHTCIDGGYQQEYALDILKEAITDYPLDGVFFNMPGFTTSDYSGNYHGICQCENCKKKFFDSTGYRLPVKEDMNDPVYRAYRVFRQKVVAGLSDRIRTFVKSLNPSIVINTYFAPGVDFIASESMSEQHNAYEWNYSATANVKPTLNSYTDKVPCNFLISFRGIGDRLTSISPNITRVWMLENMLQGAPVTYVIMGNFSDYEDRSTFPVMKEVFGFHRSNEKLFTNIQSVARLALIRGSENEYHGLIRLLSEEHIPFDVINLSSLGSDNLPRKLKDYDAVILGNVDDMSDNQALLIDQFVENGGKLLSTGLTSINDDSGNPRETLALKSAGISPGYNVFAKSRSNYLKIFPADKQALNAGDFDGIGLMMMYSDFLKCKPSPAAKGLFRLVPDVMFGPPEKCYYTEDQVTDFPGLIFNDYGKGQSVYIPWQLGAQYDLKGNTADRLLFTSALYNLLQFKPDFETDGTPLLEISHMKNLSGAFEWVGMINHSGQIGASFRDPLPILNTHIRFIPEKKIKSIRLVKSGIEIPFRQNGRWIECMIPEIRDFEMAVCTYQ